MVIDKYLQKVLDDQIIEKYVSRYFNRRSDYLKAEIRSTVLSIICENQDKYLKAGNPMSYIQGIIVRQMNSKSSRIYTTYIRPLRHMMTMTDYLHRNDSDGTNEPGEEDIF